MNLADVIRQAAQNAGERAPHVGYSPPDFDKETQGHNTVANTTPNTPDPTPTPTTETTDVSMAATENPAKATKPSVEPTAETPVQTDYEGDTLEFAYDAVSEEPVVMPEGPTGTVRSGNVVRLELFLSPDQMSSLFRALVATQHGMMTLREAANYLRVSPGTVETMAQDGTIPGLMIEGRWRFPKSSLDEWLSIQVFRAKGESDAA